MALFYRKGTCNFSKRFVCENGGNVAQNKNTLRKATIYEPGKNVSYKTNVRPAKTRITIRKHAYSIIQKILPPKNENFQIKNSDIFHTSAQKHRSTRRF